MRAWLPLIPAYGLCATPVVAQGYVEAGTLPAVAGSRGFVARAEGSC
jgi:hypothetical protein